MPEPRTALQHHRRIITEYETYLASDQAVEDTTRVEHLIGRYGDLYGMYIFRPLRRAIPALGECAECHRIIIKTAHRSLASNTSSYICFHCENVYYYRNDVGSLVPRTQRGFSMPTGTIHNYTHNVARSLGFKMPAYKKKQYDKMKEEDRATVPFFGVECEVETNRETPSDICQQVQDCFGSFVALKSDGSLNNGFEIVSAPATFEYHKSGVWEPFFPENDGPGKHLSAWTTDTAGMHVHMSCGGMLPLSIGKLYKFINDPVNKSHIEKFAGRSSSWAEFDTRPASPSLILRNTFRGAVNLNTHKGTFEVRIFRGNVSRKGVYRNIEFVQATANFASQSSIRNLAWSDFVAWIQQAENTHTFPFLIDWLVENEYLPSTTKIRRIVAQHAA